MRRHPGRNLLFSLPVLAAFCLAQTAPQGAEMLASFTINRNVNEVSLVFSVNDSHGRLRTDLTQSDFELLDNHHPPAGIRYFQRQTELPLRVALLIDASASITERIGFEKKAASVFLRKISFVLASTKPWSWLLTIRRACFMTSLPTALPLKRPFVGCAHAAIPLFTMQ